MTRCTEHRTITPTLKVCDAQKMCPSGYTDLDDFRVRVVASDTYARNYLYNRGLTPEEVDDRIHFSHTGVVSHNPDVRPHW